MIVSIISLIKESKLGHKNIIRLIFCSLVFVVTFVYISSGGYFSTLHIAEANAAFTEEELQKNTLNKNLLKDYIAQLYNNSLGELNENYNKGYRLIAVDLEWAADKKIVLAEGNQIQMTLEDLVIWMEEHEDVQIILRTKESYSEIMAQAYKEYPGLIENGIAEIHKFSDYTAIGFDGFVKIILNPRIYNYKDQEILDFISMNPHFGVILDKERANTDLPQKLREKGLSTYVDGPTEKFGRMLMRKKVEGFIVNPREEENIKLQPGKLVPNEYIVAHAGGKIGGETYTNSLEAMDQSYNNGIRLMEIDFEWTTDDKLVSTHSWDGFIGKFFNVPVKQYSYTEFENFQMINGWHQLTPKVLDEWFGHHTDAYLVTDIKGNNVEGLRRLKQEYPRLAERIIPQIYRLEEYEHIKNLGYEDIILTLYLIKNTDDEIVEFAKNNKLFAITLPIKRAKTDLPNRLKEHGIYVYAHTVNSQDLAEELESNGVSGFYTDIP